MKTKHTSGTWEHRYQTLLEQHYITSSDGSIMIARVCSDNEDDYFPKLEEANANARLISKAPELLEELRNLINDIQIQHVNADDNYLNMLYPHRKTALELIKKISE